MKKIDFKNAAAKLIYDLIGADGYVSDRELTIMNSTLNDRYNLTDVERVYQANQLSFSQALEKLQKWEIEKDIEDLIEDLELIAGYGVVKDPKNNYTTIEGFCSLHEAWLLFLIKYALKVKDDVIVFSVNIDRYRLSKSDIIYVENASNANILFNDEMEKNYDEFRSLLELYGLRLVYIPKVCEYLKEKRKKKELIDLMRYVNPYKRYENSDAQKIAENIDKITISDFVKDILPETQKNIFNRLKPSFLIKIKTSIVNKDDQSGKFELQKVNNYILIPIKNSINDTLKEIIKNYTQYSLERKIPNRKLHGRPFILHGFDRTFLNFAMSHLLDSNRLISLHFDFTSNKEVVFVFEGGRTERFIIKSKHMILYLITIIYSLYDNGLPLIEDNFKHKHKSNHEILFLLLYKKIKEKDNVNLYNNQGKLDTDISRLKDLLEHYQIPNKYWPVKNDSCLRIPNVNHGMIYIRYRGEEFELSDKMSLLMKKKKNKEFSSVLISYFE